MEQIQIFDSINNKNVNVFVAQEIAERCRLDTNFAAELVKQIEEQDVEEGSIIEIETVGLLPGSSSDTLVEKEFWSRTETLKFLKLYQKLGNKYANNKKTLWFVISKVLARRNIIKPPERCRSKWKNLIRSYKAAKERNNSTRFQYFKAVDDLINEKPLILSDTDSEMESYDEDELPNFENDKSNPNNATEKESWSRTETIKFLKIYQKYKQNVINKTCTREQLYKIISAELLKDNIHKTPAKCSIKWKNLHRTYKRIMEKDHSIPIRRFKYFKQIDDIMNDREMFLPDDLSDTKEESDFFEDGDYEDYTMNPRFEYEIKDEEHDDSVNMSVSTVDNWSKEEISKLIWAYNKHKERLQSLPNKEKFWKIISDELESNGFSRDAFECEKEWNNSGKGIAFLTGDIIEDSDNEESNCVSADQGTDTGYEKIIIETEETENTDENHEENSWADNETSTLIFLCAKHIKTNRTKDLADSVWQQIAGDIHESHTHKSADDCKKKWEEVLSTYETSKKLNLDCTNFAFFEKIDEIVNQSANGTDKISVRGLNCKCAESRMLEKQKRHAERMQMLKRRLDIEERKVKAFEEYVKYLKR